MMAKILRRILALSAKEVRHVLRDPRTLYMALGMPVVMLLLFGFGVRFDLDRLPIAVVDHDHSTTSRQLTERLMAGDELELAGHLLDAGEAEQAFRRGEVVAVIVLPAGLERDVTRGRDVAVQLLVDGADNNTAVQARAKIESAVRVVASSIARGDGAATMSLPIEVRAWSRFNPEARSAVFLVPGITAYVLAIVGVLLTALTVAREWERGSMAQLFATPVGRLEIVIGKLLPYVVLGFLTVLLVVAVGAWVFDVPFRGWPPALALLALLFITGMLGQGLLISVLTRNQMVATQVATMTSMLPSMLLSGFVFPVENMPLALQYLSTIIPARYFIEGLRGVLLRGNGIGDLGPQILPLAIFALVMIVLSTARFRRTVA
ncbi:MAG: ABC transporter permease [Sandaracinaceae bacterium]|nr:ABC transporter permease [Sandaracinaceae bacterium]